MGKKKKKMTSMEEWKSQWRRFELTTTDDAQISELRRVIEQNNLTRYELAVIVKSLRARPEFDLEHFRI